LYTHSDILSKKIQEQEQAGKALRDRQRSLHDNQEGNVKQVKMWRDFERLMSLKHHLISQSTGMAGDTSSSSSNTLTRQSSTDVNQRGRQGLQAMSRGASDENRLTIES